MAKLATVSQSKVHGMGLFALDRAVRVGEEILSESPMLEFDGADGDSPEMKQAVDKLLNDVQNLGKGDKGFLLVHVLKHSPEFKGRKMDDFILELTQHSQNAQQSVFDTFFNLAVPFAPSVQASTFRLFWHISQLNHSCFPNAEMHWDKGTKQMHLFAIRDIPKGSEVFVSYIDQFNARSKRHRDLDFTCECHYCLLTGEEEKRFEAMMTELRADFKMIEDFRSQYLPETAGASEVAEEALVKSMNSEPKRHDIAAAALNVHNILLAQNCFCCKLADAAGVQYVVNAAMAHTDNCTVFMGGYECAFEWKLQQWEIFVLCRGLFNQTTQDVLAQLLDLARVQEQWTKLLTASVAKFGLQLYWGRSQSTGNSMLCPMAEGVTSTGEPALVHVAKKPV